MADKDAAMTLPRILLVDDSSRDAQLALDLTDIQSPDMDGLAFGRRLKQHRNTQDTPIVAITAVRESFSNEAPDR